MSDSRLILQIATEQVQNKAMPRGETSIVSTSVSYTGAPGVVVSWLFELKGCLREFARNGFGGR